jgi:hypothetical protein
MNVAVVGGGIFGTTSAIRLARAGHSVTVFERANDILTAASAINQYRLHRGYHYPRSVETVRSILHAEQSFRAEYSDAIVNHGSTHVYGIASEGSLTSAEAYLRFCDKHGLSYKKLGSYPFVNMDMLDLLVEVEESWYDPSVLKKTVAERLKDSGVVMRLSVEPSKAELEQFDQIIVAAYAGLNTVQVPDTQPILDLQFEVCEKPLVRMPSEFTRQGIVIMDGPFMCIDPYGFSNLFVLGNVVHAIHARNIGSVPVVPKELVSFLNNGIIEKPAVTNWKQFVESGARFIPALAQAEHVGSLFTVRTVLPSLETTDARPTFVERISPRCIRVFSGKVANCVDAADRVVQLVED